MKKRIWFIMPALIILLFAMVSIIEASIPIDIPDSISGKWSGKQQVTFRYKKSGKFTFVKAKQPVELSIFINKDGTVHGTFGNAVFTEAKMIKNRGTIGRWFNLATDYAIVGKLNGSLAPEDSITSKNISIPIVIEGTRISGSVFHKKGLDLFPISGANLVKQN